MFETTKIELGISVCLHIHKYTSEGHQFMLFVCHFPQNFLPVWLCSIVSVPQNRFHSAHPCILDQLTFSYNYECFEYEFLLSIIIIY